MNRLQFTAWCKGDKSNIENNIDLQRSIHLSHHSNNKTNVLPTFQVHNLLTGTLLLSAFLYSQKLQKIKRNVKNAFY